MQFHEDSKTRLDRLNSLLKCSIFRNLRFELVDTLGIAVFTTFIELFTLRKLPNSFEIESK